MKSYGEKLVKAFENKCGENLINESMEFGTFVLENCIENYFDEVAWCLMTYGSHAVDVVEEWKNESVIGSRFYSKLLEILKRCID